VLDELSAKDAEVGARVKAVEAAEAAVREQLAALEEGVAALEADRTALLEQQRCVEQAQTAAQRDAEVRLASCRGWVPLLDCFLASCLASNALSPVAANA
jgi:chromosome segregation ATPase